VNGVGIVARDHMGTVPTSKCYFQMYILDPSFAEAFGACLGAEFGRYLGFPLITLEGDAREMVMALTREDEGLGRYDSLILYAKEVLKCFHAWEVSHVRREGNRAARHLAELAISR